MMRGAKDYKDTGISWLDHIPKNWEMIASKRLFSERKERARADDKQMTASQKYGVIYQEEFMKLENQKVVQVITGSDILKHVEPSDFVISMRSFQGGLEYSRDRGCISSAYVMLIPSNEVVPEFFRYLFKSSAYIQALQITSNLVRDGQAMRYANFVQVPLPVVPKDEQKEIADFLDRETSRIDQLIEKKWTLIETLPLRVEALIDKALAATDTKWIRFGHAAKMVFRSVNRIDNESYIAIGLYNRGRGIFHKEETLGQDLGDSTFSWVKPNDLIFSGQFAWEGAVALATEREDQKIASHRYPIYNAKNGIESGYLFSYFRTHRGKFLMNDCSRGAAGRNRPLNTNRLEKELIPVPSSDLQTQIVSLVRQEDDLKAKITKSIQLLNKFRASIVTEAVTGQLNIQAWQKRGITDHRIDHIEKEMEQKNKKRKRPAHDRQLKTHL